MNGMEYIDEDHILLRYFGTDEVSKIDRRIQRKNHDEIIEDFLKKHFMKDVGMISMNCNYQLNENLIVDSEICFELEFDNITLTINIEEGFFKESNQMKEIISLVKEINSHKDVYFSYFFNNSFTSTYEEVEKFKKGKSIPDVFPMIIPKPWIEKELFKTKIGQIWLEEFSEDKYLILEYEPIREKIEMDYSDDYKNKIASEPKLKELLYNGIFVTEENEEQVKKILLNL